MIVFGLLSSVSGILTFSPSAWDSTPAPPCPAAAGPRTGQHRTRRHASSCAPAGPFCQSHPGPAAVIHRHRRHHDHPARQPAGRPLGLTAVPARIFAAPAGLTAFYVIANEGPNIASH